MSRLTEWSVVVCICLCAWGSVYAEETYEFSVLELHPQVDPLLCDVRCVAAEIQCIEDERLAGMERFAGELSYALGEVLARSPHPDIRDRGMQFLEASVMFSESERRLLDTACIVALQYGLTIR